MLLNPFTGDELKQRRTRLFSAMPNNSIAIIPSNQEVLRNGDAHFKFRPGSDFFYFTGFTEPDAIALFFKCSGEHRFELFVRPRSPEAELWDGKRAGTEGAKKKFSADKAFEIKEFSERLDKLASAAEYLLYNLGNANHDASINRVIESLRSKTARGHSKYQGLLSLANITGELRLIKSKQEQAVMRKAGKISAQAHCLAMQRCQPNMHEYLLAGIIEGYFAEQGCETAYTSIVGGGDNACILHYIENNQKLKNGDLVLIDAGAEYACYAGDITRTFPVNGTFTAAQRDLYDVVLAAQKASIQASVVGARFDDIHDISVNILSQGLLDLGLLSGTVDEVLETESYRQFYMHRTGHWLGIDVHDVGSYADQSNSEKSRPLEQGMVMTVEPGLYIAPDAKVENCWKGIGIRIEDDILITDSKPYVLTAGVPKEPRKIEALMQKGAE